MSSEGKLLRLEKRHKGLARVTAAINDLYIYGVYESNYPALMDTLNEAKDACKDELRDTHVEIVSVTKANEITKLTPSTEEQLQEVFDEWQIVECLKIQKK
mgnify:CR=1 FL=1